MTWLAWFFLIAWIVTLLLFLVTLVGAASVVDDLKRERLNRDQ